MRLQDSLLHLTVLFEKRERTVHKTNKVRDALQNRSVQVYDAVRLPLQNTVTKAHFRKRFDERKGAH